MAQENPPFQKQRTEISPEGVVELIGQEQTLMTNPWKPQPVPDKVSLPIVFCAWTPRITSEPRPRRIHGYRRDEDFAKCAGRA
jgi:hypothetical protein